MLVYADVGNLLILQAFLLQLLLLKFPLLNDSGNLSSLLGHLDELLVHHLPGGGGELRPLGLHMGRACSLQLPGASYVELMVDGANTPPAFRLEIGAPLSFCWLNLEMMDSMGGGGWLRSRTSRPSVLPSPWRTLAAERSGQR